MIDLTPIFRALITLFAAIITYFVVPWLKERTTAAQQERIKTIYRIAVLAAEQSVGEGHGAEKLHKAQHIIEEHGYTFDPAILESVVYEELNLWKISEANDDADEQPVS